MRTQFDIAANQDAMRVICRAGEIAQKMRLSSVVPHTLFLALYEMARQDVVNALKAGRVDTSMLNAFEFVEGFGTDWRHVPWEIKEVASPFRAAVEADGELAELLCNPKTKGARHGRLFTIPSMGTGTFGECALPAGAAEFFDNIEKQKQERNEEVFDRQRYEAEVALLKRKLSPGVWHFDLNRERPFLAMAVKTKSGNLYTIQIELERFPQSVPKVFVTRMLRDHDGNSMNEARHSQHTLASEHGWTRICHYGSESWTPGVSLYKIYIKCALWLNI